MLFFLLTTFQLPAISVQYFLAESKELVSNMHGHSSSVHRISVHGSGRYAISTSQDTSILWDLDTFTRKRTLNGAETVGVQEVPYVFSLPWLTICQWMTMRLTICPNNFVDVVVKAWKIGSYEKLRCSTIVLPNNTSSPNGMCFCNC